MDGQMTIVTGSTQVAHQAQSFTLRGFRGEVDYAHIAAIISGCKDADRIERVDTVDDVRRYYAHLVNCDLNRDMCFVEADGRAVGYSRVSWWEESGGPQVYRSLAFLLPDWRRRGIGSMLLEWLAARLTEKSSVTKAQVRQP